MKKTTFFSRFLRETRFELVISCFLIASAMIQSVSAQSTYTAVAGTATTPADITAAATWTPTPVPTLGDANIWSTGTFYLKTGATASTNYTFYGGTINVATGGTLQSGAAGQTLTLNNLTLNGGKIYTGFNLAFTLDLQSTSNTLTLNSGSFVIISSITAGTQVIKNASLAGSGNILITKANAAATSTGWLDIQSSVKTSGFTGTFTVTPGTSGVSVGGILKLATNPNSGNTGTFGVSVPATLTGYTSSVKGKLSFYAPLTGTKADSTLTLASLTLGTTAIAPGTYKLSDLLNYGGTDLSVYLDSGSKGYIMIPAVAPSAPTSVVATNANGIASVAFNGTATTFTVTPTDVTGGGSVVGTSVTGNSSPILLPALTANHDYTFTVTATTISGTSAASTPSNLITITAPGTILAVAAGAINALPTWSADSSIPLPVVGDANIWSSNAKAISLATSSYTFNGGTLLLAAGSFIPTTSALWLNNFTMTSGTIYASVAGNCTIDLQGKIFTLTGGNLSTVSSGAAGRALLFQNCSLAGSGNMNVTQLNSGAFENWVEFTSTVNTTGFKGTFTVQPGTSVASIGGELKLNAIDPGTYGTFGVIVPLPTLTGSYTSSVPGKLYFTAGAATVKLASLSLGGINIGAGTYTLAELNGYLGGDLSAYLNQSSTGTITVTGTATSGLNTTVQNNLVIVKGNGFQLKNNANSIEVFNTVGKCIHNKQNVSTDAYISMPNTGVYIVKVKTETGISVQKVMIK